MNTNDLTLQLTDELLDQASGGKIRRSACIRKRLAGAKVAAAATANAATVERAVAADADTDDNFAGDVTLYKDFFRSIFGTQG